MAKLRDSGLITLRRGSASIIVIVAAVLLMALVRDCYPLVFAVTNTDDSGEGSLRWAIESANATAGSDSIVFAIPGAEPFTIQPQSPLPAITEQTLLDGTTQQGYAGSPVIELLGSSAGTGDVPGIEIQADGTTVKGLVINRFASAGIRITMADQNVIAGNYLGTDISGSFGYPNLGCGILLGDSDNNIIGGTTQTDRNVISANAPHGIMISGSSASNVVQGNYIGLNAAGTRSLGNAEDGIQVGDDSHGNTIGGSSEGHGNVVSGNLADGVHITNHATDNIVVGNYVGTDATGTAPLGNGHVGVQLGGYSSASTVGGNAPGARNVICDNAQAGVSMATSTNGNVVLGNYIGVDVSGGSGLGNHMYGVWIGHSSYDNTVGGTDDGSRNVISANLMFGVNIEDEASGNSVMGNYIGVGPSGSTAMGNTQDGVRIVGYASRNTIGGDVLSANVIAHNARNGVRVQGGLENAILCNAIHSNGSIGIDLGGDGVTNNDTGDADTGPNGLQNYPTLMFVSSEGGTTTIQGVLNSSPNATFRVQFFFSTTSDPTGYGEGQTYIGEAFASTDSQGNAAFDIEFQVEIPVGSTVSATATDVDNNTSEFGPVDFAVPVELSSFTAVLVEDVVGLAWTTQSESNNFGFRLFRSDEDSPTYFEITDEIIRGAGNSAVPRDYEFADSDIEMGRLYSYQLRSYDSDGSVTAYEPISIETLPSWHRLSEMRPNPFIEETVIEAIIANNGLVKMEIHDIAGRLVRVLVDSSMEVGRHEVSWDGRDERGFRVPPGSYVLTMSMHDFKASRTVVLNR